MKLKTKIIWIVLAVLILAVAGIIIYTFIFKDKEENIEFAESLPSSQDQDVVTEEIIAYDTWVNLSDKVDSDSDGLTDYEETEIYGTDPKNKDSDGDGFSDKEELDNSHNPLVDSAGKSYVAEQLYLNFAYKIQKLEGYCFNRHDVYPDTANNSNKWICRKGDSMVTVENIDDVDVLNYFNINTGRVITYNSLLNQGVVVSNSATELDILGFDESLQEGLAKEDRSYQYLGDQVIDSIEAACFEISENTTHCLRKDNGLPLKIEIKDLVTITFNKFNMVVKPQSYFVVPTEATITTLE